MKSLFAVMLADEYRAILIEWLQHYNAEQQTARDEWTLQQAFEFAVGRGIGELEHDIRKWNQGETDGEAEGLDAHATAPCTTCGGVGRVFDPERGSVTCDTCGSPYVAP